MAKGIISAFFCFFLFVLLNIIIFHNFEIKHRFRTMASMFLFSLLLYTGIYISTNEAEVQRLIAYFIPMPLFIGLNALFLHFLLCYFYIYFIQLIDRSPSTRIMTEMESSSEKKLTIDRIKLLYDIKERINSELEDMVMLGCLEKKDGLFRNTRKGDMQVKVFKFIRDYLRLRRS